MKCCVCEERHFVKYFTQRQRSFFTLQRLRVECRCLTVASVRRQTTENHLKAALWWDARGLNTEQTPFISAFRNIVKLDAFQHFPENNASMLVKTIRHIEVAGIYE